MTTPTPAPAAPKPALERYRITLTYAATDTFGLGPDRLAALVRDQALLLSARVDGRDIEVSVRLLRPAFAFMAEEEQLGHLDGDHRIADEVLGVRAAVLKLDGLRIRAATHREAHRSGVTLVPGATDHDHEQQQEEEPDA
jgi:hypothetical protein